MLQATTEDYQLIDNSLEKLLALYRTSTLKQKPLLKVEFDFELKSCRMLGRARSDIKNSTGNISINYEAFSQNRDRYIDEILSHEFAHIITSLIYGRVRPHGREFKYVCYTLFPDAPDIARGSYRGGDFILESKKSYKKYPYRCKCQKVYLTSIRHNKILKKKMSYFCRICKGELIYIDG
jgi:SprT protein